MPWLLRIYHLDIQSVGDATIIVAQTIPPAAVQRRTVLIDGGKAAAGAIIRNYLVNDLGINRIDVVVITHYDEDHFYGVVDLLQNYTVCDNAIFYDPGDMNYGPHQAAGGFRAKYAQYRNLFVAKPTATRATAMVNAFDTVNYILPAGAAQGSVVIPRGLVNGRDGNPRLEPHWLVNREVMWGNGGDGMNGRAAFASAPPAGAPTLTCIAAHKYVIQTPVGAAAPGLAFVSNDSIFDGGIMTAAAIRDQENKENRKNPRSLACLLTFNNFRYYLGGDIESHQEDGANNRNTAPLAFQPGLMSYLNNGDTVAGRVLAMKASHHGSNKSSSREFITRLRPSAVIISTGEENHHNHPAQQTVNILDGYIHEPLNPPPLAVPADGYDHPPTPPPPPRRPVLNYLTGWQDPNPIPPLSYAGDSSETAGDPHNGIPGHVRIVVSEAESLRSVVGQCYRGMLAAAQQIILTVAPPGAPAAAAIAEAGATHGTAQAVAVAVGMPLAVAERALNAVAYAGDTMVVGVRQNGVVQAALAAAPGGVAAANHAAVAVGAGTRTGQIGTGAPQAIGMAVTNQPAAAMIPAITATGATALAAQAAAHVAVTINAMVPPMGRDDAGFGAAAALGAAAGGALSAGAAAAIAAAIAATVAVCSAANTATVVTQAAIAAGMAPALAALAGAVASAGYYEGVPAEVNTAVTAALQAAGLAGVGAAAAAGIAAQAAASIPNNQLFSVMCRVRISHHREIFPHIS